MGINPSRFRLLLAIVALLSIVALIGGLDYLTGADLAFSIFYLFPIGLASWYVGMGLGAGLSVASAITWYLADTLARSEPYPSSFIPGWNTVVRLITFFTVTVLLARLREVLLRETRSARIDPLTGAANVRAFYEEVEVLLSSLRRYGRPFGLIYLDMDNLKQLNDTRGHATGDEALKAMVAEFKRTLRLGDTVARLGGDEFAILVSDTDAAAAETVAVRLQSVLRQRVSPLYQVTCSIGVFSCVSPECSVDQLLQRADSLMYEAKRSGKDAIRMASPQTDARPHAESAPAGAASAEASVARRPDVH
jgi:diguanylate cyclase (GGDEF)-like protein